ncbi:MAG: RHS repeat protein, partial [Gammaproteobacteria bacterium]
MLRRPWRRSRTMSSFGTESTTRRTLWCALLATLVLSAPAGAEDQHRVADEYARQVTAAQTIEALGPELFGERTDHFSGRTEFIATDVSLPGNDALPVRIGRRFVAEDRGGVSFVRAFGDWDLELPHLHGIFARTAGSTNSGWLSSMPVPTQRCSILGEFHAPPPDASGSQGGTFTASEYWGGNWLHVPGAGEQELLVIAPENPNRPVDGAAYYWVTSEQWFFSCLPATANGVAGEAFLARAPDGTRYWFDRPVKRAAPVLKKPYGEGPLDLAVASRSAQDLGPGPEPNVLSDQWLLSRDEVWILPSRIEDRFGNVLTFSYDPANPWRLLSLTSSDGRQLTLSWDSSGRVTAVSDGSRSWSYSYGASNSLTAVTLPDGSRWKYSLAAVAAARITPQQDSGGGSSFFCEVRSSSATQSTTIGTLTHPSGAVGQFSFRPVLHGRSWVPKQCIYQDQYRRSSYALYPYLYDTIALIGKSVSGPGLATPLVWSYDYGATNHAWEEQCLASGCTGTKTVTVSEPDGTIRSYTYGNHYRADEGKLLEARTRSSTGTELRRELTDYQLTAAGQGYPARTGISPNSRGDGQGETPQPAWRRRILQQGVTFSWQALGFDGFARPAAVTRASDLGYSRGETLEYHDDLAGWVLGQTRRVTNSASAQVIAATDYDSRAQPWRSHTFGLLRETRGYHPDGSLASVTDGNSHTTTLTDWYRGVPRRIAFADNTAISATVAAQGWITSVTDANGYKTSYAYDALGRLKKLTPPAGDSVSWTPTTVAFVPVSSTEYGIGAGHWRRTEARGNYRRVSYYDALWRPVIEREYDTANASGTQRFRGWRYDPAGRTSFVGRPRSTVTSIASFTEGTSTGYDGLGRPTAVQEDSELGALTTSTDYLNGFQTQVTDPRGNLTTTSYQAFDEPDTRHPTGIQAPEGQATLIVRDPFGKPLSLTRSGGSSAATRQYVYDSHERLCKRIEPETGATFLDYDNAGNLAWSAEGSGLTGSSCDRSTVPASQRITRSYDAQDRLTAINYPGTSADTTYSYTPDGLLASLTADSSTWSYSYNRLQLLTGETLGIDSQSFGFSRSYNSLGQQTRQGYPVGTQVAYTVNALGQITA